MSAMPYPMTQGVMAAYGIDPKEVVADSVDSHGYETFVYSADGKKSFDPKKLVIVTVYQAWEPGQEIIYKVYNAERSSIKRIR